MDTPNLRLGPDRKVGNPNPKLGAPFLQGCESIGDGKWGNCPDNKLNGTARAQTTPIPRVTRTGSLVSDDSRLRSGRVNPRQGSDWGQCGDPRLMASANPLPWDGKLRLWLRGVSGGLWLDGVVPLPRPERSIFTVGPLRLIRQSSGLS